MKPYLLLDIDGVFNPFGWGFDPEGFIMHSINIEGRNFKVFASEDNRRRLQELGKHFQLVWATTWEEYANQYRGQLFGLDNPLPVISFSQPIDYQGIKVSVDEQGKYIQPEDATYKFPYVAKWAEDGRAFAWIDDMLGEDVLEWSKQRDNTLLIKTEPQIGLTDHHVQQLITFSKTVD